MDIKGFALGSSMLYSNLTQILLCKNSAPRVSEKGHWCQSQIASLGACSFICGKFSALDMCC